MFGTYEHDLDIEYHKKKAMGLMVSKEVKRPGYKNLNKIAPVDHKIDLQFGGTNEVNNLAALCNNCHAEKTASNNL